MRSNGAFTATSPCEMSAALKAAGLRYGAYVSLGEWNYPIVKDDALASFGFNGTVGPLTPETPFLSGKVPVADYTGDYLLPSLKELIDQTSPDMLWFDGEWEADASVWRSPETGRLLLRPREGARAAASP